VFNLTKLLFEINFKRTVAKNARIVLPIFTKQMLSRLFENPLYCGVNIHGKIITDLTEKYNFEPIVTVNEFLSLNKKVGTVKIRSILKKLKRNGVKANLLIGCVFCDYCKHSMVAGITPKRGKNGVTNYFYCRCDQKGCRKSKIRAKEILAYASDYVEKYLQPDQKTWLHFKEEMRRVYEYTRKQNISNLEVLILKQTAQLHRQNDTKEELTALERVPENNKLREQLRIDYDNYEKELQT
jgi:hypothetical protein